MMRPWRIFRQRLFALPVAASTSPIRVWRARGRAATPRCRIGGGEPPRWRGSRGRPNCLRAPPRRDQHVADPLVGDRQIAPPLRVAGIGSRAPLESSQALARLQRRLGYRPRSRKTSIRSPSARASLWRSSGVVSPDSASCRCRACARSKNPAHQVARHAGTIAEFARKIDNEGVCRLGRRRERPLGAVALFLRQLPLLLGDVALLDARSLSIATFACHPASPARKSSNTTALETSRNVFFCWRTSWESRSSLGRPWMAAAKSAPASMKRASRALAPSR